MEDVKVTRSIGEKLQHRSSIFFFLGKNNVLTDFMPPPLKGEWLLAEMVPRLEITCWPCILA